MPSIFLPPINRPSTPSRPHLRHSSLYNPPPRPFPRRISAPNMPAAAPLRPATPARDKVLEDRLRMLNLSTVSSAKRFSDSSDESDESCAKLARPVPLRAMSVDEPSLSPISSVCDASSSRSSSASSSSPRVDVAEQPNLSRKANSERPSTDRPNVRPPKKVPSAKNLAIPTGKVEHIHVPRPATPVRLPRPKVFITQSSLKGDMDSGQSACSMGAYRVDRSSAAGLAEEDDFFFSDEEEACEVPRLDVKNDAMAPGDVLTSKVKRAISNLRSISFQAQALEDLDTAWGQAGAQDLLLRSKKAGVVSSRWRRPRGRISSKNGVQEFECYSEADARSACSASSRARAYGGREPVRGGVRSAMGSKKSVWKGRRDRHAPPASAVAAQLLANRGQVLAASSGGGVTAVVPAEEERRCSVDKYVEFIHASAQRESRGKLGRKLPGRVMNRAQAVFRRKWK